MQLTNMTRQLIDETVARADNLTAFEFVRSLGSIESRLICDLTLTGANAIINGSVARMWQTAHDGRVQDSLIASALYLSEITDFVEFVI
jgi:hypothetical protein